jgi:hypothetical protein
MNLGVYDYIAYRDRKLSVSLCVFRAPPVGGVSATLNLSSNSKSIDDNSQQRFRVKPWTTNYELGLGIGIVRRIFYSPSLEV